MHIFHFLTCYFITFSPLHSHLSLHHLPNPSPSPLTPPPSQPFTLTSHSITLPTLLPHSSLHHSQPFILTLHFFTLTPSPITSFCTDFLRGSAISKIIGGNASSSELFHNEVRMWVYEEMIEGKKLTDIINSEHENVKYLPGIKLPNNVVSCEKGEH